jgi:YebC/PmpR family DNA-binding regulatory protein
MPMDTIDRAIKRAAGAGEANTLDEITYEGYGPGGAALLIEVLTDNRNRSVAEVRSAFNKAGASMAEAGAVAWQFEQRGVLIAEPGGRDADELGLIALEAGATDVRADPDALEVYTTPGDLEAVRSALMEQNVQITSAEVAMVPTTTLTLEPQQAASTLRLMERLEDLDDVQKVYTNLEISEEAIAVFAGA